MSDSDEGDFELILAGYHTHQQLIAAAYVNQQLSLSLICSVADSTLSNRAVTRVRRFTKFLTHWEDLKTMPDSEFIKRYRLSRCMKLTKNIFIT